MIVVSDTSPLNYLILIDVVEVLPQLYGRVLIPKAVAEELVHLRTPSKVRDWMARKVEWLDVVMAPAAISGLGRWQLAAGESEAIALAATRGIRLIAIDEMSGRQAATEVGLTFLARPQQAQTAGGTLLQEIDMTEDGLYICQSPARTS